MDEQTIISELRKLVDQFDRIATDTYALAERCSNTEVNARNVGLADAYNAAATMLDTLTDRIVASVLFTA